MEEGEIVRRLAALVDEMPLVFNVVKRGDYEATMRRVAAAYVKRGVAYPAAVTLLSLAYRLDYVPPDEEVAALLDSLEAVEAERLGRLAVKAADRGLGTSIVFAAALVARGAFDEYLEVASLLPAALASRYEAVVEEAGRRLAKRGIDVTPLLIGYIEQLSAATAAFLLAAGKNGAPCRGLDDVPGKWSLLASPRDLEDAVAEIVASKAGLPIPERERGGYRIGGQFMLLAPGFPVDVGELVPVFTRDVMEHGWEEARRLAARRSAEVARAASRVFAKHGLSFNGGKLVAVRCRSKRSRNPSIPCRNFEVQVTASPPGGYMVVEEHIPVKVAVRGEAAVERFLLDRARRGRTRADAEWAVEAFLGGGRPLYRWVSLREWVKGVSRHANGKRRVLAP